MLKIKFPATYWRADLKWIFGLIFTFGLISFLGTNLVFSLTSQKPAKKFYKTLIEEASKKQNLAKVYPQLTLKAKFFPQAQIENPLGVKITGKEIASLSLEEFKELFGKKLFEEYYLKSKSYKGEMASIIGIMNFETHQKVKDLTKILAIFVVLSGILMIIFAYSFDKLISLGLSLAIACLPYVVGFLKIQGELKKAKEGFVVAFLPLLEELKPIFENYQKLLILGIVLFVGGILGFIIKKIYLRFKET